MKIAWSLRSFHAIFTPIRFAERAAQVKSMLELLNTLLGGKAVASDTPIPNAVALLLNVEQHNGKPRKKSSCQFEYLRLRKCGV